MQSLLRNITSSSKTPVTGQRRMQWRWLDKNHAKPLRIKPPSNRDRPKLCYNRFRGLQETPSFSNRSTKISQVQQNEILDMKNDGLRVTGWAHSIKKFIQTLYGTPLQHCRLFPKVRQNINKMNPQNQTRSLSLKNSYSQMFFRR